MSISEMFSYLTLTLGLDAEYILDRCEGYEVNALMKHYYYKHKDYYDMARMISYFIAQVNTKKRLKPKDVIEFPWEKEYFQSSEVDIKEDMERLMKATQIIQDQLHARANGKE